MSRPERSEQLPLIRYSHPLAFSQFLANIGGPTEHLLRRSGLPVYCEERSAFVPVKRAWAFFDAVAHHLDPGAGWHVGSWVGDQQLSRGLLGRLEHAPTLYLALKRLVTHVASEATQLQLGIEERRDDILFWTRYRDNRDWPGYSSSQSYQLMIYLDLIRHFLGRDWLPEELGIEAPEVPAAAAEYLPGSRILKQRKMGYIAIPRFSLAAPPPLATDDLQPLTLASPADWDFVGTLRRLIEPYLPQGYPTAHLAASLIDTSPRTLSRRLQASGTTYQAVVDSVRFDVAKNYLLDPDVSVIEAGQAVGFEDPSHFARMFRRISGLSPTAFREAALDR